ncbi:MAG TPA: hypothetical protein VIT43_09740 [Candidatus Dormibacteraeota bacterium]
MRRGSAALVTLVVLAVLIVVGYSSYAAFTVYQDLENGRSSLASAQASLIASQRSADQEGLQSVAGQLQQAERDFSDASQRARQDPALRLAGALPGSGEQIDAAARLGMIGADLSRAGQAATAIALQVAALRQQYSGRALTPDDLQAILQRAQTIAANYKGSIDQIGLQLRAAHAERAKVTTTGLVSPLQNAYAEVDRALDRADTAFLRYQDLRSVLSDLLGLPVAG